MSVVRVNKTKDYTVLSNFHLRDKQLSLKAKGLLSVMLSLPDDWDYTIEGLTLLSVENETAITNTLKELKNCGYLEVVKLLPNQTKSGRLEYEYNIFEVPKQEGKKQDLEILGVEVQGLENQGQINTNILNTNKENTKYILNKNIDEVIEYLRDETGRDFRLNSKSTRKFIGARLNDGYTVEDLKKVIDLKIKQWAHTDMEKYIRPETLFNETKFSSYISECPKENRVRTYGVAV